MVEGQPEMPTLPLLAGDLHFLASSHSLPLFLSTINVVSRAGSEINFFLCSQGAILYSKYQFLSDSSRVQKIL